MNYTSPIYEIRKRYGLTQKALSELTGVPVRTIQDWEGNRMKPPAYVVALIKYYVEHSKGDA